MRLTAHQQNTICRVLHDHFGPDVKITLFGSRADDTARGGDIDLLVESNLDPEAAFVQKLRAVSAIQQQIGDQKIDLVTAPLSSGDAFSDDSSVPLVVRKARKTGIQLSAGGAHG
ncbi:nucleotidyltransferase domain-containing protein [Spirochaeta africana]|uniref:Nucleotidyltransferase family protein n=1 Tax=Spirochaeta africana (strain ATCC 700263 / DSM 8902 / Z-7692) TaxID=889378 RepID=H9UG98_SPIAZ|nr:nucleotidyltransferase domain-containing protein [Spirochaeta africana]AFG36541.1 nucleotidyltransferase family protein [Spirochaeta africana DSM 8902]